jgi:Na+/serine symporter
MQIAYQIINLARRTLVLGLTLLLSGCYSAPSLVMFGASFPDWLLCSIIGTLVMTVIHLSLHKTAGKTWLEPVTVVYPCVTFLAAMLAWLLFFPN